MVISGKTQCGLTMETEIANDQTVPKGVPRQPEYISVVMKETDAICISYIFVSGNGAQWVWYGDLGWTCGADWYHNYFMVGGGTYAPRCVWIDQDHPNGLRFQGLSLHMPDFQSTDDRITEYNNNPDTLCKSSPRMKFWPSIVPDTVIPFFNPVLEYTDGGADLDPSAVIDQSKRSSVISSRPFKRDNGNNRPGLPKEVRPTKSETSKCELVKYDLLRYIAFQRKAH